MDVLLRDGSLEYRTIGGTLDFLFFSGPSPQDAIRQYGAQDLHPLRADIVSELRRLAADASAVDLRLPPVSLGLPGASASGQTLRLTQSDRRRGPLDHEVDARRPDPARGPVARSVHALSDCADLIDIDYMSNYEVRLLC